MKVFISWSAGRSRKVAEILVDWLREMFPDVEPWMSKHAEIGVPLLDTVNTELKQAEFAVLCLTVENFTSAWINYEAGALVNRIENVCPYIIDDIKRREHLELPIFQRNAAIADREGTLKLAQTINSALKKAEKRHFEEVTELKKHFDSKWPRLRGKLQRIRRKPDGDEILIDFAHAQNLMELHRKSLTRVIFKITRETLSHMERDDNYYNLDHFVGLVYKAIDQNAWKLQGFRTQEVGNLYEFLMKSFTKPQLKAIVEPLADNLQSPKLDELERLIEKETEDVFDYLYQLLRGKSSLKLPTAAALEDDPVFQLGKQPVIGNVKDASENHDRYLTFTADEASIS